ncbi:FKBP-type peptidyl-prolyl cis-trans isomerase [Rhodocytophaga aerolata]|uniref:Peptidyl-prolyl cis-trans isomerase n=1 Tax=Rhodocytophaga aerolata TaxID=455078 RepID=A0ABT8R724_9BACT|nr:FKBP-type peptidyl-prolyl cis-trans isomerase [Rhodocytophaga aerolata]MDO1447038.1 FKBP-type peptidyl-prolyl cis-trans isomerase [Rhodocytophaga aerolata]
MKNFRLMMLGLVAIFAFQACTKDPNKESEEKYNQNLQQIQQYFTAKGINPWNGTTGWQEAGTGDKRYYYVIQSAPQGGGTKPATGDQLVVQYVGRLLDETKFDSSASDKPLRFAFNDGTIIEGFNLGIGQLQQGQVADLYLPHTLAYGNRNLEKIPPYSALKFRVTLEKLMTEEQALVDYYTTKKLKNADSTAITPFSIAVGSNNFNVYRIITKVGTGNIPDSTGKVTLNYRGLFLNGLEFDKNTISPSTSLDKMKLIPGFKQALLKMKEGEKAVVLMPSGAAYGAQGASSIPPYAPLVFEMELLKVENP